MVIGIVAKNGMLLLDAEARFRDEGMSPPRMRYCTLDAAGCGPS